VIEYVELTVGQVALASLLILIGAAVSLWLRLRMEGTLLIASVRTVVQLALLGLILHWIFDVDRWAIVLGIALVMTIIAGLTAAGRAKRQFRGVHAITTVSVMTSSWLVTGYVLGVVFQGLDPWYHPQYSIPLLGMVLGNTLNGISVGLSTLTESLTRHRDRIEMLTALGATRGEAAAESIREAVRTGMIPIVNSMMIVGLVSFPGMMTGQIVSGVEPGQAVRYQIVIMFLIAGATALGTFTVVHLATYRLFAPDHRFRSELLSNKPKRPGK